MFGEIVPQKILYPERKKLTNNSSYFRRILRLCVPVPRKNLKDPQKNVLPKSARLNWYSSESLGPDKLIDTQVEAEELGKASPEALQT